MSEADRWLERANEDIRTAKVLLDAGIWNQVCFHAQQCTEKSLKAALVSGGTLYPRSHNLPQLLGMLDKSKFQALFDSGDGIRLMDRFYMSARYPDVVPGMGPSGLPTQEEAAEALALAQQVYDIVTASVSSGEST
jgi:HEPN domain-containing protein